MTDLKFHTRIIEFSNSVRYLHPQITIELRTLSLLDSLNSLRISAPSKLFSEQPSADSLKRKRGLPARFSKRTRDILDLRASRNVINVGRREVNFRVYLTTGRPAVERVYIRCDFSDHRVIDFIISARPPNTDGKSMTR